MGRLFTRGASYTELLRNRPWKDVIGEPIKPRNRPPESRFPLDVNAVRRLAQVYYWDLSDDERWSLLTGVGLSRPAIINFLEWKAGLFPAEMDAVCSASRILWMSKCTREVTLIMSEDAWVVRMAKEPLIRAAVHAARAEGGEVRVARTKLVARLIRIRVDKILVSLMAAGADKPRMLSCSAEEVRRHCHILLKRLPPPSASGQPWTMPHDCPEPALIGDDPKDPLRYIHIRHEVARRTGIRADLIRWHVEAHIRLSSEEIQQIAVALGEMGLDAPPS